MIESCRQVLKKAIADNKAEGVLFSGGLDSSIITALNPSVKAVSVSLLSYGEDKHFISRFIESSGIQHYHKTVEIEEAVNAIPEVIKILESFDPAIPNDLVVYFGLKKASELGIKSIATGDGSDELFAGYSFMEGMEDLEAYIKGISRNMRFSSNTIAEFFGINIKQPFMDRKVIELALDMKPDLKIRQEGGKTWGKWILRKTFEEKLGRKTAWQSKRPLEYGSGMTCLREVVASKISDEEFEEARKKQPVKFINKEHFYYYKVYIQEIGKVPEPKDGQKACPGCGAGMAREAFHCRVCGNVLDWRL